MTNDRSPDTLSVFHMHNPDISSYALIAHVVSILEQKDFQDPGVILRNISNLLEEAESTHLLHLICQKLHVDYLSLMQTCQGIAMKHMAPRVLLHLMLFPPIYISQKLEIDPQIAVELLNELRRSFTIDDPILWLKRLLSITEKERLRYTNAQQDLIHGLAPVNQPVDTAEERKQRDRRFKPTLRPRPPGAKDVS